ncbi:hypothetical protein OH77DRAFT_1472040 [Trametes cingulata]|nr:hypothetical protein OH77DRAFT_1472040 [Trametes cingulata]
MQNDNHIMQTRLLPRLQTAGLSGNFTSLLAPRAPTETAEGHPAYMPDLSFSPNTPTSGPLYGSSPAMMRSRLLDPPLISDGLGLSLTPGGSSAIYAPDSHSMSSNIAHTSGRTTPASGEHPTASFLNTVERLKSRIYDLEKSNAELAATVRTLEHAYTLLATAQPALLAASGNPLQLPMSATSGIDIKPQMTGLSVASALAPPIVQFDAIKHANIRFFTRHSFKPYMKGGAKHDISTKEMPIGTTGKTRAIPIFLEGLDGSTMAPERYLDLRALIRSIFQGLQQKQLAPVSWSKISDTALFYLIAQVTNMFPEMAECEGYWKIKHLSMLMYSDFTRADRTSATPANQSLKKRSREGDAVEEPAAKRRADDQPRAAVQSDVPPQPDPLPATSPTPSPPAVVVVVPGIPKATNLGEPLVAELQPASRALSPQSHHDLGSSALLSPSSVPLPSRSDTVDAPHAGPSEGPSSLSEIPADHQSTKDDLLPASLSETACSPSNGTSDPGTTSLTLADSGSPSAGLSAPETIGHASRADTQASGSSNGESVGVAQPDVRYTVGDPLASFRDPTAAPLPNLIDTLLDKKAGSKQAAAEPGPSKAPTNATTVSGVDEAASSKGDGRKKPTKMRVTKHKSARNLFAHRFMKENPSTTVTEFDKAWRTLSDDVLKEVNALREYALLCSAESLDEIAEAWAKMSEEKRKVI